MVVRHRLRWWALAALAGLALAAVGCQKRAVATASANTATVTSIQKDSHLRRGRETFLASCAMCHGEFGEGDGPLAADLRRQSGIAPARLNDRTLAERLGRHGLVEVITRGGAHTGRSNLMPPWGERLSGSVIGDVADYVLVLPELAPGIPAATIEHYQDAPAGAPERGQKLFAFYCTACHGVAGHGDGMYADTIYSRVHVRPRNLTDNSYFANRSDRDLYATISLGGGHVGKSTYMPMWGVTLNPAQIKDVLSYVRVLSGTAPKP